MRRGITQKVQENNTMLKKIMYLTIACWLYQNTCDALITQHNTFASLTLPEETIPTSLPIMTPAYKNKTLKKQLLQEVDSIYEFLKTHKNAPHTLFFKLSQDICPMLYKDLKEFATQSLPITYQNETIKFELRIDNPSISTIPVALIYANPEYTFLKENPTIKTPTSPLFSFWASFLSNKTISIGIYMYLFYVHHQEYMDSFLAIIAHEMGHLVLRENATPNNNKYEEEYLADAYAYNILKNKESIKRALVINYITSALTQTLEIEASRNHDIMALHYYDIYKITSYFLEYYINYYEDNNKSWNEFSKNISLNTLIAFFRIPVFKAHRQLCVPNSIPCKSFYKKYAKTIFDAFLVAFATQQNKDHDFEKDYGKTHPSLFNRCAYLDYLNFFDDLH